MVAFEQLSGPGNLLLNFLLRCFGLQGFRLVAWGISGLGGSIYLNRRSQAIPKEVPEDLWKYVTVLRPIRSSGIGSTIDSLRRQSYAIRDRLTRPLTCLGAMTQSIPIWKPALKILKCQKCLGHV